MYVLQEHQNIKAYLHTNMYTACFLTKLVLNFDITACVDHRMCIQLLEFVMGVKNQNTYPMGHNFLYQYDLH